MAFTQEQVNQVWAKAAYVGPDKEIQGLRKDICGAWIKRTDYGNRESEFGWEIDHIRPVNLGGSDHISNLQPLHWQNNAAKGDGPLVWAVTSR